MWCALFSPLGFRILTKPCRAANALVPVGPTTRASACLSPGVPTPAPPKPGPRKKTKKKNVASIAHKLLISEPFSPLSQLLRRRREAHPHGKREERAPGLGHD